MTTLRVLVPGFRSTVQDHGRYTHLRMAVPPAGPADPFAFEAAQHLVGNQSSAAAIEIVGLPFRVTLDAPRLIAATGREVTLRTRGPVEGWTAVFARAGEEIAVEGTDRTRYAYLAVAGGIALPEVLGSRSTYLPASIGPLPRALAADDVLPVGEPRQGPGRAGLTLPYAYERRVHVLPGPHTGRFPDTSSFYIAELRVNERSDRMGVRLEGPRIPVQRGEILSLGMVAGAVQVPSGGQPIVLLADHQTTGGYPVIATVIRADLGAVAQAVPGETLSFQQVDPAFATERLRSWGKLLGTLPR
ncbi:MAG: biotin-dependent carboxyltransferase family protein [Candidatus Limnocylindria bacterium]